MESRVELLSQDNHSTFEQLQSARQCVEEEKEQRKTLEHKCSQLEVVVREMEASHQQGKTTHHHTLLMNQEIQKFMYPIVLYCTVCVL